MTNNVQRGVARGPIASGLPETRPVEPVRPTGVQGNAGSIPDAVHQTLHGSKED